MGKLRYFALCTPTLRATGATLLFLMLEWMSIEEMYPRPSTGVELREYTLTSILVVWLTNGIATAHKNPLNIHRRRFVPPVSPHGICSHDIYHRGLDDESP